MEQPFAESSFEMNYDLYRKFYRASTVKQSKVFYILAAFILLISIGSGIAFGFDKIFVAGIVLGIVSIFLRLWQDFLYPKSMYKKSRRIYDSEYSFKLFERYYHEESKSASASGVSDVNYDSLFKALESVELFLLYITTQQAHVIPKACLNDDAVLQLRSILKETLGKKFRSTVK